MGYNNWVTPKEAAEILKISKESVYRSIAQGAPVYTWGPAGGQYRIDIPQFVEWMANRKKKKRPVKRKQPAADIQVLRDQRHAHIARLAEEAARA